MLSCALGEVLDEERFGRLDNLLGLSLALLLFEDSDLQLFAANFVPVEGLERL